VTVLRFGKRNALQLTGILMLWVAVLAAPAYARLEASLDRYRIAMGDTVRLTLRSDDASDPAAADMSGLEQYFEVLQRSSSVSTQIINGQRSQTKELTLELTPRREGSIVIPPFEVDGKRSEALSIDIGPEPQAQADDEVVTFEAEIDRSSVYVQGQLLLTLRVQQAVNLDSRSITELDIENAYVETLGQNSFQRTIGGRPWLVHEIRYAIFPESSGTLTIPVQTFSGRVAAGRRTLFDTRPSGRLIRRRSDEITVDVLPRPDSFPNTTWLPAADLAIEEQWSAPVDQLKIGDSVTRTITLTAKGLQGAQLPPIEGNSIDGLRAYPDQPVINNVSGDAGVTGIRIDSLALVAVKDGEYTIPELEIPWWDTETDSLRIARLPARSLRVLPNPGASPTAPPLDSNKLQPTSIVTPAASSRADVWPWVAGICALGWIGTSLLWWRRGGRPAANTREAPHKPVTDTRALLAACKNNDPQRAQSELRAWLLASGHRGPVSDWVRQQGSEALSQAVDTLEQCLYQSSDKAGDWNGEALAAALRDLPRRTDAGRERDPLPALYLSK
jgi:hypothetical protein